MATCGACGTTIHTRGGGQTIMCSLGPHFDKQGTGEWCPGGTWTYATTNPDTKEVEWLRVPKWEPDTWDSLDSEPELPEEATAVSGNQPIPWRFRFIGWILKILGKERVTAVDGTVFWVNTSKKVCGEFGFQPGDSIRVPALGVEGVVVGIAPVPEGRSISCGDGSSPKVWVCLDGNDNRVCFFPNPAINLEKV